MINAENIACTLTSQLQFGREYYKKPFGKSCTYFLWYWLNQIYNNTCNDITTDGEMSGPSEFTLYIATHTLFGSALLEYFVEKGFVNQNDIDSGNLKNQCSEKLTHICELAIMENDSSMLNTLMYCDQLISVKMINVINELLMESNTIAILLALRNDKICFDWSGVHEVNVSNVSGEKVFAIIKMCVAANIKVTGGNSVLEHVKYADDMTLFLKISDIVITSEICDKMIHNCMYKEVCDMIREGKQVKLSVSIVDEIYKLVVRNHFSYKNEFMKVILCSASVEELVKLVKKDTKDLTMDEYTRILRYPEGTAIVNIFIKAGKNVAFCSKKYPDATALWLISRGFGNVIDKDTCVRLLEKHVDNLTEEGNVDALEHILGKICVTCSHRSLAQASANGHIAVLEWWNKRDKIKCNRNALVWSDNLSTLNWWKNNVGCCKFNLNKKQRVRARGWSDEVKAWWAENMGLCF